MRLVAPSPHEVVYIDTPWHRTPCGTARTPYKTMTWQECRDFDLGAWLAPKAVVFAWMTGPTHLREAAVLSHWCERFGLHEAVKMASHCTSRGDTLDDLFGQCLRLANEEHQQP